MADTVLVVDIGGTKTTVALADVDDILVDSATAPTPARQGPEAIVGAVAVLAQDLITRAGGPETVAVRGVGVAAAGVVDATCGVIVSSTDTITRWAGTNLQDRLREALSTVLPQAVPIHIQNDVDAHALGEYHHGAAVGSLNVLVVAVGTGVGSGVLMGGRVLRGAHHVAGEIAHVPLPGAEHLRCPCGRNGHLEAIGSGLGMHAHYLSLGGDSAIDARGIAVLAHSGDPIAQRALEDSAAAVGRGIAGAVTILDPEKVIVTGGVADIGDAWWTPLRAEYRAQAIDALQGIEIVPGALASEAPLRGAAASAWSMVKDKAVA